VGNWTDIKQVAAGTQHSVGLKKDGTVIAVGDNDNGQLGVDGLANVSQVAAGTIHSIVLMNDGTVIVSGENLYGQLDVGNWTNIIQVATGCRHTVGLKHDRTLLTAGGNSYGQCNVGGWMDIVQVVTGVYHTVGLKADGTVVAAGPDIELAKWNLGVVEYALTISSTPHGSVTTPGEGMFTYNAGLVVRLVAKPERGYRFVKWTGDVDTIANINAATTIITMRGDYAITASFAVNWLLIGGIIAAAVAAGLAIFFTRRRRAAQTKRQGRKGVARKKGR
jgi:hypothetical protein